MSDPTEPHGERPAQLRWLRPAFVAPALILLVCLVVAFVLLETGPVAERQPRPRSARVVEVEALTRTTEPTQIDVMGTVVPTREVVLRPQVSGRIIEVSADFVPGGRFAPGEVMLRIDPSDARLAIRQREAELAQARAELQIERGNQTVARSEFELLGETIAEADRDLVLRQPQLDSVRARVEAAAAALERARLDLERTTVRAPFHALVRSRGAELGSRVDPSTALATLVDTSAYWVEVLVPASQLRWIELPGEKGERGARAILRNEGAWGPGEQREGRVVRLVGDIESEGRMARVLVRVDDPLALEPENQGAPPLLLGSYVAVRLGGRHLVDVVPLDRSLLRGGDRVWLLGRDDRLEIRSVEVAFRGAERVLVQSGLETGDRIVTSELSSPVAGMPLRAAGETRPIEATVRADALRAGGADGG